MAFSVVEYLRFANTQYRFNSYISYLLHTAMGIQSYIRYLYIVYIVYGNDVVFANFYHFVSESEKSHHKCEISIITQIGPLKL